MFFCFHPLLPIQIFRPFPSLLHKTTSTSISSPPISISSSLSYLKFPLPYPASAPWPLSGLLLSGIFSHPFRLFGHLSGSILHHYSAFQQPRYQACTRFSAQVRPHTSPFHYQFPQALPYSSTLIANRLPKSSFLCPVTPFYFHFHQRL